MESKVIQTLDKFVDESNGSVRESHAYMQLRAHLRYFEQYIAEKGCPDVIGMLNQVITNHAMRYSSPRLSVANIPSLGE